MHQCQNCGEWFDGNICPSCGVKRPAMTVGVRIRQNPLRPVPSDADGDISASNTIPNGGAPNLAPVSAPDDAAEHDDAFDIPFTGENAFDDMFNSLLGDIDKSVRNPEQTDSSDDGSAELQAPENGKKAYSQESEASGQQRVYYAARDYGFSRYVPLSQDDSVMFFSDDESLKAIYSDEVDEVSDNKISEKASEKASNNDILQGEHPSETADAAGITESDVITDFDNNITSKHTPDADCCDGVYHKTEPSDEELREADKSIQIDCGSAGKHQASEDAAPDEVLYVRVADAKEALPRKSLNDNIEQEKDGVPPALKSAGAFAQAVNILKYLVTGNMRRAVHYSISDSGKKGRLYLFPLQVLLPLMLGFCLDTFICGGEAHFFSDTILKSVAVSFALWAESFVLIIILMRLMSAVLCIGMNMRSIISLVTAATLPMIFLSVLAALAAWQLAPLMLPLILLGAAMFVIMLYMGMEAASISNKVLCSGWFSIMMLIYLSLMCIFSGQLIVL